MATRGRPQTISDDELLDAAKAVFLEQAVGATTAAIARKARVAESVIFHRYKTKEALFCAVLDREARVPPVLEDLAARAGKGEIADTLFDASMGVIEAARAMMPFFMVASMLGRAPRWKLEGLRERMRRPTPAHLRAVQLMAGFFNAEAERGRLRKVSSESLARIYLGTLMQHVIQQYWWGGPEVVPQVASSDYVRSLVDVLLHGLVPRGPSPATRE